MLTKVQLHFFLKHHSVHFRWHWNLLLESFSILMRYRDTPVHYVIRDCHGNRGNKKSQVDNHLPLDRIICHLFGIDKRFQHWCTVD